MEISKLIESLEIIQRYRPDVIIEGGHDVLWACDYNVMFEMSEADSDRIQELGWREEYDSLAHSL